MSETDTTNKLDSIAKQARAVQEDGVHKVYLHGFGEAEIFKCKAKNVAGVLEFVSYLMKEMGIKSLDDLPQLVTSDTFFLKLISNSADRLFLLAAEFSDLKHAQVQELELDDAILLIKEIVSLNKPFFLQSVLPLVQSVLPSNPESRTKTSEGLQSATT